LEILRELEGIAKKPVVKGDFGVLKGRLWTSLFLGGHKARFWSFYLGFMYALSREVRFLGFAIDRHGHRCFSTCRSRVYPFAGNCYNCSTATAVCK
jgi:hypothetical protein